VTQSHIESYFPSNPEEDLLTPRNLEDLRPPVIEEVSEPASPEEVGYFPPSTSMITNLIRKSPPSTSPPNNMDGSDSDSEREDEVEDASQQHLTVTDNGVAIDYSEQTPLLKKCSNVSTHPDYIHGETDIEHQKPRKRMPLRKLPRKLISWPRKKGGRILRVLTNKKNWTRKAMWQNVVIEPAGLLPAVVLGCLLNILDALSYGKYVAEL
jgi:SulP family sulfate permease